MVTKDAFADHRRPVEENYFRQKEQEFIERLRARTQREEECRQMAAVLGLADEHLLDTLQSLGYTRESITLLPLLPLLQVAWADGRVSAREGDVILAAARRHGIKEDHPSYTRLLDCFDERPPEAVFNETLRIINALLTALPPSQRAERRRELLDCCRQVAAASGGIIAFISGGTRISKEEAELLERLNAHLRARYGAAPNRINAPEPSAATSNQ